MFCAVMFLERERVGLCLSDCRLRVDGMEVVLLLVGNAHKRRLIEFMFLG